MMQLYLASVGLMVAILILGILALFLSNDSEEEIFVKCLCGALVVVAAINLGIRIGEGVF